MRRSRFIALSVLLDALFVNAGIVAAFYVRFGGELPAFNFSAYVGLAPVITVVYLAAGWIYGLYEPERTEGVWQVLRAAAAAVTLGAILTAAIAFVAGPRFFAFSRLALVLGWGAGIVLLTGWRLVFMRVASVRWPEQRVLVIGSGPLAAEMAAELERRSRWGYRVIGVLTDEAAPATRLPVLGTPADAAAVIAAHDIGRVIIVSPVELRRMIEDLVTAHEIDVRIDVVPELYEVFIGQLDGVVADIPLMEVTSTAAVRPWYLALKRMLDLAFALITLVALAPLLLAIALAILLTMGRPVVYSQVRAGKSMKPFKLHKFRTMVRDAEEDTGPVLAEHDDARVTPLGRFLRTYRLDELPQLVNIIKGEMSFVGPRPERSHFVDEYLQEIPGYRERFRATPGVTGLAQVSGGYATTPARKLKYDLIYLYHQSLAIDLQIIAETLRVVLTGRGAR